MENAPPAPLPLSQKSRWKFLLYYILFMSNLNLHYLHLYNLRSQQTCNKCSLV